MTPQERLEKITTHLQAGGRVMTCSYTRPIVYDKRHISMFRATDKDLLVQRGKHWDCLNFTPIKFSTLK